MLRSLLFGADATLVEALVNLLGGERNRIVRVSRKGDIIALTDKAEDALDQKPGECIYARLTDTTEEILREVIEKKKTVTFSEDFGERVMFDVTAMPTEEGAILLLEPKNEQYMLDVKMQVDIRTSLQDILSMLYPLRETEPELSGDIERRVYQILRRLTHAELLRSAERRTQVRFKEGDLVALCRRCAEEFMEAGGPAVEVSATGEMKAVFDPSLLLRAILNLLTNAQDAKRVRISLKYQPRNDRRPRGNYLIAVEDDGKGLAPENLERLYQGWRRTVDLTQTKIGEDYGLPGTGLPVVVQIVEGHHGRLLFERNEAGGTRFCISFPDDLKIEDLGVEWWPEEEDGSIFRSELSVMRQRA